MNVVIQKQQQKRWTIRVIGDDSYRQWGVIHPRGETVLVLNEGDGWTEKDAQTFVDIKNAEPPQTQLVTEKDVPVGHIYRGGSTGYRLRGQRNGFFDFDKMISVEPVKPNAPLSRIPVEDFGPVKAVIVGDGKVEGEWSEMADALWHREERIANFCIVNNLLRQRIADALNLMDALRL